MSQPGRVQQVGPGVIRLWTLAVVCTGIFMLLLDSTPDLEHHLRGAEYQVEGEAGAHDLASEGLIEPPACPLHGLNLGS